MSRTIAVIGAGFGSEGKGRTVDDLLEGVGSALVVRHNGSAHATHTVCAAGRSHAFGHFGSGTFRGVPTILARDFVVCPEMWRDEATSLAHLDVQPRLICDMHSLVITPFHRAANQVREILRDEDRRGSSGIGFGEAIDTNEIVPKLSVRVGDLNRSNIKSSLLGIRRYLADQLGAAREIHSAPAARLLFNRDPPLDQWIATAREFLKEVEVLDWTKWPLPDGTTAIFEGTHGLLLDPLSPFVPHVTRCRTGLDDIAPIALRLGRSVIEVYYVTRCYATRHGAGVLPHECEDPPVPKFSDLTNQPTPWQGAMRFAPLDIDLTADAIRLDISRGRRAGLEVIPNLVMTCVDQLDDDGMCTAVVAGHHERQPVTYWATALGGMINAREVVLTYGPSRGSCMLLPKRVAA